MNKEPSCPKCKDENSYFDGSVWVCPNCFHEWNQDEQSSTNTEVVVDTNIYDANKNILQNGDSVSVIKDLKVKGSSFVVKVGTKVKNIRLVESDDGHNIACKIDGIGAMNLKSEFVKKI